MHANWKRNAALFLASQSISFFGSTLVQYAITWHITLTTQSGSMMTLAILFGFLPTLLVSPFAGVWADRYDRRRVIAGADALIALATLLLAILFLTGYGSVWLLFAASAVRSLGAGIQTPAVGAFLPQFVPQEKLTQVNATNTTLQAVVSLLSPMVAAALLTVASIEAIFFVDVATAALAIGILLLFLQVPAHPRALEKQPAGYFSDLRAGIAYIGQHSFLRAFFFFNALFFIFAGPVAFLTPLQVARSYGEEVWRLSAIEVGFSVGMILGGLLMTSWSGLPNRVHSMALANFLCGLFTFGLGVTPHFWIYVGFMAILGISLPIFNTPATVLLQQRVEDGYLGRVFGVNSMIASSLMPLSMLIYGPLADMIPIEWLLLATGPLLVVQSLLMVSHRALVEAGRPLPAPET